MDEAISVIKNKRFHVGMTRQIMSGRQLQKLAKDDSPVFLAIVRSTDSPYKRYEKRGEQSQNCAAKFAAAHSITEGQKRKINHENSTKKDIMSFKEREQQVLDSVLESHRKDLENLIKEYQDIFPEKLPKRVPPKREV